MQETLEERIWKAVTLLRAAGHSVTFVVVNAVVDGPAIDGKLPDNPDTGPGSEPGRMEITVHDQRPFPAGGLVIREDEIDTDLDHIMIAEYIAERARQAGLTPGNPNP